MLFAGGEACRNLRGAVAAAAPVAVVRGGNAAYQWANAVSRELDQFKTYACMDAGNFPQCVKPGNNDEVQARRIATRGRPPMPNVIQPGHYDWKKVSLKMRFDDTQKLGKQGECTSFGYLAAHILTKGREQGPRVELVAVGHMFMFLLDERVVSLMVDVSPQIGTRLLLMPGRHL